MKTEALGHWLKSKLVKMFTSRIIQEESVGIGKELSLVRTGEEATP